MKKIAALSIVFNLCLNALSQNVGIGTGTPKARLHIADSNVVFTGPAIIPATTNFNPPLQGAGTRMLWYPQRGAFRVGTINGSQWNKEFIGTNSFASGSNTIAGGHFSIAVGDSTTAWGHASASIGGHTLATGSYSTALGYSTTATGIYSTAIGALSTASGFSSFTAGVGLNASESNSIAIGSFNTASGNGSMALGSGSTASKNYSVALGNNVISSGNFATALGAYTVASGTTSTSMGGFTIAKGDRSTAMGSYTIAGGQSATAAGYYTNAEGHYSMATGYYTKAKYDYSLVAGMYNDTAAISLFDVGNGTSDSTRRNALTVLRNGNVGIGVSFPSNLLQTSYGTVRIEGQQAANIGTALSIGGHGKLVVDRPGLIGGRFTIDDNGNVGIGHASPQRLLHVGNGTVRIEGPSATGTSTPALTIGGAGDIIIDKPGTVGGRLVIKENGNVGIGKTNPSLKLEVSLSNSSVAYHPYTSVGIEKDTTHYLNMITKNESETGVIFGNGLSSSDGGFIYRPATGIEARTLYFRTADLARMKLYPNGNLWIQGALTQNSDARLKKNILPLSNSLNSIQHLNGYSYYWADDRNDQTPQLGLLAQEVQKVYPQLVKENSSGELSVNYIGLIPVLLEGLKEQQKQIEKLQQAVDKLSNK